MPSVFGLSGSDLCNLGPDRAVDFFRRLLWAESSRVGVGKHLVHVPQKINEGDGGIDAVIRDAQPASDDLIPAGTTGFQIKASDLKPAECKRELHQREDLLKPIKPEVENILHGGGSYVLVLFSELTVRKKNSREQAIKEELRTLGYSDAKVHLFDANQLAGFAEQFPAIVRWLKPDRSECLAYDIWAQNDDVIRPRKFVVDPERGNWIENTREAIRNRKDCSVYRVTGLSGIGKTRIVFELLGADDLRNLVVYVKADAFRVSPLLHTLQTDGRLAAIVVVDECDLQEHDEFVRAFASRGPRLTLFTLSHDIGKVPLPANSYVAKPLGEDMMKEVLASEFPTLPPEVVRRLSGFADGYPRIAVLLAESYSSRGGAPGEYLTISDDALMDRLIGGSAGTTSDHFRKTKRVLTYISLFKKVGYEGSLTEEAKWLASVAGVQWQSFRDVVGEQLQRGIIQGQNYIYVTPFMLRVHLLTQWWETQGLTKGDFSAFLASIPNRFRQDMILRFIEHIRYVSATQKGRDFTKSVLGDSGIYADGGLFKTELGGDFFLALSEADPESALRILSKTVGTWSRDNLLTFTAGRRDVIWALERIAMWRPLFADAAKILLALAEAENEAWSNNASGVFADLFSPGYGQVAPTEAPPQERLPVLKEALVSESRERRMLALKACETGLQTHSISRTIGAESQGLHKEPQLWMPKTYGEWFDAYRLIWNFLASELDGLPPDEQAEAIRVLLHQARGLVQIELLAPTVLDTMDTLARKPYTSSKDMLAAVVRILHYDGKRLTHATQARLESIRSALTGTGFPDLMRRYVGMDLLEDRFDEEGKQVDQTQPKIEELAVQATQRPDLLKPELVWLVTKEAPNGFRFGYELGKRDESFSLLSLLLEAQRATADTGSLDFLGGYFRALSERDLDRWERTLDEMSDDPARIVWVPDLTWRSRLPSDRAANRILLLASQGLIPVEKFRLFAFGGVVDRLSDSVFYRWLDFLLSDSSDIAVSVALDLSSMGSGLAKRATPFPKDVARRLLMHEAWYRPAPAMYRQAEVHAWADVAKAFISDYPEDSIDLVAKILEHLGEDNTIAGGFDSQAESVLTDVMKKRPELVWNIAVKYLGPPINSRAFHIKKWLRGGDLVGSDAQGALSLVPPGKVWEWVERDLKKRAWYLSSFVPAHLFREKGKTCLAYEVLVRYGEREDVRRNLMANFSTGMWAGAASAHFQKKKQSLLEFKKEETNQKVLKWIDEYVQSLDRDIEKALVEEEREEP